jgi:membrane protease YdiL (CAAX protease family)
VPWGIGDAVGAFILVFALSIVAFGDNQTGALITPLRQVLAEPYLSALQVPVSAILFIVAVVLWLLGRKRGWVRLLFGSRRPNAVDILMALIVGGVLMLAVFFGLGTLLETFVQNRGGELPQVQQGLQNFGRDPRTIPIFVVSAVVLAPLAEELYFRGMLYPAIRKRLGAWPAIGLSGLVFGATHFDEHASGYLLLLLVLFPVGMILARLYEARPTLWAPILAHATYNGIQVAIFLSRP